MPDPATTLLRKIRAGEDSFLELKEVVFAGREIKGPRRDSLANEMAAFANARGGELVLGVSDTTREVTGIPLDRLDVAERYVVEIARDSVDPPLDVVTRRLELPGPDDQLRFVLGVVVPRSPFVHRSPSGYFRRVGSSKREMRPEELARLFTLRSRSGLAGFDEQPVGSAAFEDLDPALIDRFRTERSDDDRLTLARKLGIATRTDAGGYAPTVAGVLLCARRPERWLRNAWIQAVAYHGRDVPDALNASIYQLDAEDITGPLDAQIAGACRFVTRNQKVRGIKTIGRTDIPQYDLTSVFEAVVNAVAHRDYSIHGSKIRLRLFSDRIELHSPGGLANTLELDMLPHRQATRNEAVASLLSRIPVPGGIAGLDTTRHTLMDRRGEGVGVLLRRSEAHSGKRPVYRLLGETELMLTIFAANPLE
ncbi:ATP-binding protein [Candidatus Palauibacter sp.]|uniref:ATP-binding protein n=1 Tax=Candidatus Palauibacter sp. TaxID=3101350 RepID=UPI003C6F2C50